MSKKLQHLIKMLESESRESDSRNNVEKALKLLTHALDVKDVKRAKKAVDQLAKAMLE